MATLQDYLGITALRDAWPKWKANVIAVNNQVINHVTGTADKHAAQDVTYSGNEDGVTVKAAIDNVHTRVDTIVAGAGASNTEILDARGTYAILKDRLDGSDSQLADNTQQLNAIPQQIYITEKAKQVDLNVEKARIDNFVAMPPTVDNVETTDIRVGSNGTTFASAGTAVRTQIIEVQDGIYSNFKGIFLATNGLYTVGGAKSVTAGFTSTGDEDCISMNTIRYKDMPVSSSHYSIAFFDASMVFISGVTTTGTPGVFTTKTGYVKVPTTACYVRILKKDTITTTVYSVTTNTNGINNFLDSKYVKLINEIMTDGKVIANVGVGVDDGKLIGYAGWYATEFLYCNSYEKIKYENMPILRSFFYSIAFFTIDKVFISGVTVVGTPGTSATISGEVSVPVNAYYMILIDKEAVLGVVKYYAIGERNMATNTYVNTEIGKVVKTYRPNFIKYLITDVLHIGDSLTEGWKSAEIPITENYTYYTNKIFGWNRQIRARAGYDALTYWAKLYDQTLPVDWAIEYQAIFIMLGTNGGLTDTLVADTTITAEQTYLNYATTETGCYCKIVEYVKEHSPKATIFLCTPPYAIPSQRGEAFLLMANKVIKQIGVKYGIYVIDTYNLLGVNAETTVIHQPLDGLHFGEFGYANMANVIGNEALRLVEENPKSFNDKIEGV